MKVVITKIKGNKKGEVADLWRNSSFKTHVREVDCRNTLLRSVARNSNPTAVGAFGRPICCQNTLGIICNMGFQGNKSKLINQIDGQHHGCEAMHPKTH